MSPTSLPIPPQIQVSSSSGTARTYVQRRNLVVCIDGTSNRFSSSNTNVVELYKRLEKDPYTQLTYYNSGVGTLAAPSYVSFAFVWRVFDYSIDLAIGWNFEKAVLKAYRWLADNYRPEDRIFVFGFSRGAYQVRTLAAMIDEVGLLQPGNEEQIPFAYELYARNSVNRMVSVLYISILLMIAIPVMVIWVLVWLGLLDIQFFVVTASVFFGWVILGQTTLNLLTQMISRLRSSQSETNAPTGNLSNHYMVTFSREARVHFLGVWDTVSSLGHLRSKDLPKTVDGENHICVFRHALALDERRVKFLPEYRYGGASQDGSGNELASPTSSIPKVKETWFRGSHPDIGGKHYISAKSGPNNPSLRWMAYEAAMSGLRVNLTDLKDQPAEPRIVKNTLNIFWRLMEYLPIEHRSYKNQDSVTLVPHHGKMRIPVDGQKVHKSVEHRPNGIDVRGMGVDSEVDEIRESLLVRQSCVDCDQVGLNNFEEIDQNGAS